jgi:hypothetical protein
MLEMVQMELHPGNLSFQQEEQVEEVLLVVPEVTVEMVE